MMLTADQITIAVTVYDRREYLLEAIRSALGQTRPVPVMVVEDAGPDAGLEAYVRSAFGSSVAYHRNRQRRGLFDNWNACLELCPTPWLSILHDDDVLEPGFVEAVLELASKAPGRCLYFGETRLIDETGRPLWRRQPPLAVPWQSIDARAAACETPFPFPGQLINVAQAKAAGGFRRTSQYCGDWEMWFKLVVSAGAAQTGTVVAQLRQHTGWGRGTTRVQRSGRQYGLVNVQRRRNLAWLRQRGVEVFFDRRQVCCQNPWATTLLIKHGAGFSRRFFRYNCGLVLRSQPANWWLAVCRWLTWGCGYRWFKVAAVLWRAASIMGKPGR
jgi:glycosyltransferase involved in cell wall biosynthesis